MQVSRVEEHHLGLFDVDINLLKKRKEVTRKYLCEILRCDFSKIDEFEKNGLKYYMFANTKIYKRESIINFIYGFDNN